VGRINPIDYFKEAHGAVVTSPFGPRRDPLGGGKTVQHNGTDLGGKPRGHIWTSPFPGEVTHIGKHGGRGLVVVVLIKDTNILQLFQHLDKALCRKGDLVTAGSPVGTNGVTGNVTGPHLHYELRVNNGTALGFPVWGDPEQFTLGVVDVKTYTVVKGDTLYEIAQKFGVTVDELRKWNNRTPDQDRSLKVGTVLFVSDPNPDSEVSRADFDKIAARVKDLEDRLSAVKKAL